MSYLDELKKSYGKKSLYLYHFTKNGVDYFYTSRAKGYTETLEDGSTRTWEPLALTHSHFEVTTSITRATVSIVFPQSSSLTALYFEDSLYESNSVKIYHQFTTDESNERITKFSGRVIAVKSSFTRITLTAENSFTELRRKGLSAILQRPCRHALYHAVDGVGCWASLEDHKDPHTCLGISGSTVEFDNLDELADDYYNGGILIYGSKMQAILKHEGNFLKLLGPLPDLANGWESDPSIIVTRGCNGTRASCATFAPAGTADDDLALGHGGMPWMSDEPFSGKSVF